VHGGDSSGAFRGVWVRSAGGDRAAPLLMGGVLSKGQEKEKGLARGVEGFSKIPESSTGVFRRGGSYEKRL